MCKIPTLELHNFIKSIKYKTPWSLAEVSSHILHNISRILSTWRDKCRVRLKSFPTQSVPLPFPRVSSSACMYPAAHHCQQASIQATRASAPLLCSLLRWYHLLVNEPLQIFTSPRWVGPSFQRSCRGEGPVVNEALFDHRCYQSTVRPEGTHGLFIPQLSALQNK